MSKKFNNSVANAAFFTASLILLTIIFGNTGSGFFRNLLIFVLGTIIGTPLAMLGRFFLSLTGNLLLEYSGFIMGAWSGMVLPILLLSGGADKLEMEYLYGCVKGGLSKNQCTCMYSYFENKYDDEKELISVLSSNTKEVLDSQKEAMEQCLTSNYKDESEETTPPNNAIISPIESSNIYSESRDDTKNLQVEVEDTSIYKSKKISIYPSNDNLYTPDNLLIIGCDKTIYSNRNEYSIICNIVKEVIEQENTYPLQELVEFGGVEITSGVSGYIIDSLILYSDEVWKDKESSLEETSNIFSAIRFGEFNINELNVLLYNGKPLFPNIQGNNSLSILNIYHNDDSDIILIQNNGGTACPALYHIVEVSSSHDVIATSKFGSCSDLVSFKKSKQGIFVTMPGFQGPFEPESNQRMAALQKHSYLYKDGKITQSIDYFINDQT